MLRRDQVCDLPEQNAVELAGTEQIERQDARFCRKRLLP
jgi:hypothetical protein